MLTGRVLDRFDLFGQLSSGGMSDVYLARHARLAAPVVVKTLRAEIAEARPDALQSMSSAAHLMARVTSPHVVRVLDVGETATAEGPMPCLVEEYVDGLDLAELDAERRASLRRPLPLWAVAEWTAQAASGLHAAHQAGVIHRDVKPANLFLYGEGNLKVGDFGVAVPARGGAAVPAGTLAFMAPEQMSGEAVDRRADLFSLGATAFVMRYGFYPFEGMADAAHPEVSPRFPPATSPEEAFFQHVLARLLVVRSSARPRTARNTAEVLRTLAAALRPRLPTDHETGGFRAGGCLVTFEVGDIAQAECDGIVNSAYASMAMDQGVGAALVARGGASLQDEARAGGPRILGGCVLTKSGTLSCRGVLHAVSAWQEISCVGRAMQRVFLHAEREQMRTLAVPAVGTGQGGIPVEACAQSIAATLRLHLMLGGSQLSHVRLVLRDEATRAVFADVFEGLFFSAVSSAEADELHGPVTAEDMNAATMHASSGSG